MHLPLWETQRRVSSTEFVLWTVLREREQEEQRDSAKREINAFHRIDHFFAMIALEIRSLAYIIAKQELTEANAKALYDSFLLKFQVRGEGAEEEQTEWRHSTYEYGTAEWAEFEKQKWFSLLGLTGAHGPVKIADGAKKQ